MADSRSIIISAGGTGGHIIPAVTIGLALKEAKVTFTCGKRSIEKTIYDNFNLKPVLFDFDSFSPFSFVVKFPKNLLKSVMLILKENPSSVIVAGNYTSVPMGLASVMMRKKLFAIEQDSLIGKANKVFARFAYRIFTAYEGPFAHIDNRKAVFIGHVLRDEIRNPVKTDNDIEIKTNKKIILVMGGSQGALTMTGKIIDILSKYNDFHLIVIAGKSFDKFKDTKNATILPFYKNMGYLYSMADMIIARSGALSVAEIASTNKPAIFIPLKSASNDEQKKNVVSLMKKNIQFEMLDENNLNEKNLMEKMKKIENLKGENKSAESIFKKQMQIIENYV